MLFKYMFKGLCSRVETHIEDFPSSVALIYRHNENYYLIMQSTNSNVPSNNKPASKLALSSYLFKEEFKNDLWLKEITRVC